MSNFRNIGDLKDAIASLPDDMLFVASIYYPTAGSYEECDFSIEPCPDGKTISIVVQYNED